MEVKWRIFSYFWKVSVIFKRFQRRSKRYQLYLCLSFLMVCTSCFYLLMNAFVYWNSPVIPDRAVSFRLIQNQLWESMKNTYATDEIGCKFPILDPYSEETMRFLKDAGTISCETENWVDCYLTECQVKKEIFKRYRNVVCNYKDIIYVNDRSRFLGLATKVYGDAKYYLNRSDHVKVSCTAMDKTGLGLLSTRWYGSKAGFRPIVRKAPPGRKNSLNVLIVGFDSVSRNGFIRKLPKSYQVITQELKATVLKGFHVLGDGTPATLFPILSGKSELEHPDATKKFSNGQLLDPKNFIFHKMKSDGYHTAYFEDMPWVGSFQYRFNGFSGPIADHFLQPFLLEDATSGLKLYGGPKYYCLGDMPQYLFMLNLTRQFMEVDGKKFCFTFIADISHDNFNLISVADDDLVEFLRDFKASERRKDTLLIVMGDHGSRYSPVRDTYQGKIEERLPFLAVLLPEQLIEERPDALSALKENDNVLITPFDFHNTFLDVMGLKNLANDFTVPGSNLPRGMSFLERIPKSRNCGQAAILPHWCVCIQWSNVSVIDPLYTRAGIFLAQFINKITLEQRHLCAERTLTAINWVMRHGTNTDVLRFRRGSDGDGFFASFVTNAHMVKAYVEDYQAKIVMAPGHAVFEGSMKYYVREDRFEMPHLADISRITPYGHEPDCISDVLPHLNKYCYCKNMNKSKDDPRIKKEYSTSTK